MLHAWSVALCFWSETINSTMYILDWYSPSVLEGKTPYDFDSWQETCCLSNFWKSVCMMFVGHDSWAKVYP
jgi:hypothetical protein